MLAPIWRDRMRLDPSATTIASVFLVCIGV